MGNTNKFKLHMAEKFLNSFSTDNIWMFIGKPDAWTDEASADTFVDSQLIEIQNWKDILSVKRVSDVSLIVPHHAMTTSVFAEYDDNTNIFDDKTADNFFAENGKKIYKCLSNNSGSVVAGYPTSEVLEPIKMADGYVWKYMYTISATDWDKYQVTSSTIGNWIPVKRITSDSAEKQYDVVMKGAVDGEIRHVTTKGNYTFQSGQAWLSGKTDWNVLINKDLTGVGYGSGFTATLKQHDANGLNLFYVDITAGGSDYRKIETVHLQDNTNSGNYSDVTDNLRPILSPIGGHGWDAVSELGGFRVMVSVDIDANEDNFIKENDFRKIGLIVDPYKEASTFDYIQTLGDNDTYISGEKYSSSIGARQTVKIRFENSGDNDWPNDTQMEGAKDNIFTQLDNNDNPTDNKAILTEVESSNQTAHFLVTSGSIDTTLNTAGTELLYPKMRGDVAGAGNPYTLQILNKALSSVTKPKLKAYTGNIIYVDNIEKVDRSGTQKLRLVVEF